ncbi:MAG: aminopeptidase P family protein [Rhizomicrobium sp.]
MRQSFGESTAPDFGRRHVPRIRRAMAAQDLDGFIIPHEDEYKSDHPPAASDRLAWATGFSGTAGMALILPDRAVLFVDGRYTLQARSQVDRDIFDLCDLADGCVGAYLERFPRAGGTIGYDPRLHTVDGANALRTSVERAGVRLLAVQGNPLDIAWGEARPGQPTAPVVAHGVDYAGEDSASKRARVAEEVRRRGADAALLTSPSSVAWLFNIRGGDVIREPLPLGRAILSADGSARLFLDPRKVTEGLPAWLGNRVSLESPDHLPQALAGLKDKRVLVDPALASAWFFDALEAAGATVLRGLDPCAMPRACKNAVEAAGAREAHRRDGAALTRLLHWLATEGQRRPPDEKEVVVMLEGFREETGLLKDLSFDTIAAANGNGAMPHYHPCDRTNQRAARDSLLLVDSGGQYLDGTTDVTRTVAIGEPTAEMKRRNTLVLKGHLALARLRFPAGTTGSAIDAMARAPLWAAGLDYDHGTGHGVGVYLCVNEGPQRIAKPANAIPLEAGMIVSNEPGYYKEGEYGVRIENLEIVMPAEPIAGGERPMHRFEALTLAPIDKRLVDVAMLSAEEIAQFDAYHCRVLSEIGPRLSDDVRGWLEHACAPLAGSAP